MDIDPSLIEEPDYDADEGREEYIARMQEEGYEVFYPRPNQLQIDMDSDDHYSLFRKQFKSLLKEYPSAEIQIKPSRNGLPGRHAVIKMPFDMDDAERIAWQAALGSDPFRELMSLFRLRRGDSHPTLFVENKEEQE